MGLLIKDGQTLGDGEVENFCRNISNMKAGWKISKIPIWELERFLWKISIKFVVNKLVKES